MAAESGTYIGDLVASEPHGAREKKDGDDHLRLIKTVLQNSFKNLHSPVFAIEVFGGETDKVIVAADNYKFLVSGNGLIRTIWLPTLASVGSGFVVKLCLGGLALQAPIGIQDGSLCLVSRILPGKIYTFYSLSLNAWAVECSVLNNDAVLPTEVAPLYGNLTATPGTRLLFHQAAAAAGWAIDGNPGYADRVIRTHPWEGASIGGGWVITGLAATQTPLGVGQIPAISPNIRAVTQTLNLDPGIFPVTFSRLDAAQPPVGGYIENFGGNQPHGHTVYHDGSWRPAYTNCHIAYKL